MNKINMFPRMKPMKLRPVRPMRPMKIRNSQDLVKTGINLAFGMAALGLVLGAVNSGK